MDGFARGRPHDGFLAGQSVETARRALTARFKSGGIESAELDARLLVGAVLGLDLTGLITAAHRQLSADEATRLEDFARRRLQGEPVARILGHKEFWGLPLKLSPATLVPRPDTETVVELALELLRADDALRSPIAHRSTSAPAPAPFCWHYCRSCRSAMGSAPTSRRGRPCKPQPTMPPGAGLSPRATFLVCDYASALVRHVRSDRVQSALYPLSGYRKISPLRFGNMTRWPALDGGADGLSAYRALIPQALRLLAPGGCSGCGGRRGPKRPRSEGLMAAEG